MDTDTAWVRDELVGLTEFASLLLPAPVRPEMAEKRAAALRMMRRRDPAFPSPRSNAGRAELFGLGDLLDWSAARGQEVDPGPQWRAVRAAAALARTVGADTARRHVAGTLLRNWSASPLFDEPGTAAAARAASDGLLDGTTTGEWPRRLDTALDSALAGGEDRAALLETVLAAVSPAVNVAATATPDGLARLMAGLAAPAPGNLVYDPALGEGTLGLAAARQANDGTPPATETAGRERATNESAEGDPGRHPTWEPGTAVASVASIAGDQDDEFLPGTRGAASRPPKRRRPPLVRPEEGIRLVGAETDHSAAGIAAARLLCAGVRYRIGDGIQDAFTPDRPTVNADVVLVDPPLARDLTPWVRTAIDNLAPGGRAVLALPTRTLEPGSGIWAVAPQAVETVVVAPDRLRTDTGDTLALWVLTKKHPRRQVLLLDARRAGTWTGTRKTVSETDVSAITAIVTTWRSGGLPRLDGVSGRAVRRSAINEADGDLRPETWLAGPDLRAEIGRALELTAELEALVTGPLAELATAEHRRALTRLGAALRRQSATVTTNPATDGRKDPPAGTDTREDP